MAAKLPARPIYDYLPIETKKQKSGQTTVSSTRQAVAPW